MIMVQIDYISAEETPAERSFGSWVGLLEASSLRLALAEDRKTAE